MRRSLILRLVDVTLLLLLTLMAIATIRPADIELPVSERIDPPGALRGPLRIAVTADGSFRIAGAEHSVTLAGLPHLLPDAGGRVEFLVARDAEARLLRAAHRAARDADLHAVFLVRRTR